MASHERPDPRVAYRAAWTVREATGDTSEEVLLRQLRLQGVLMDPDSSGGLALVLGFWRRGVTARQLNWEIAKVGGRAALQVGRAYWEIAKTFRGAGSATPVPFEATLGEQGLSDLLRETGGVADGDCAAFGVWFDVRTVPEPNALVMFGDDVVGRSRIPDSESADLRAAGRDDLFASGSLDVHASGGLLLVDSLSYYGLTDVEDDEGDDA